MKYTKTEKFYESKEQRKLDHTPKGLNETYWNEFATNSGKSEGSLKQYKSAVNRFLNSINGKDVLTIEVADIENYLNIIDTEKTRENAKRYINSFISYTISNNLNKAIEVSSKELVLSLIPQEYKNLIIVLMSK